MIVSLAWAHIKASGPDDISRRMFIATENTICRPFCKLFNLSFNFYYCLMKHCLIYIVLIMPRGRCGGRGQSQCHPCVLRNR